MTGVHNGMQRTALRAAADAERYALAMRKVLASFIIVFSSVVVAGSLTDECEALKRRLLELDCDKSMPAIAQFMESTTSVVVGYELGSIEGKHNLSLLHDTLSHSAKTVQDCLVKHSSDPSHKPLISAHVGMTFIVHALEKWISDSRYQIPHRDYFLKKYHETISDLKLFTTKGA